ncbi:MAG: 2-amino-4-hydroxy-6-hydroxymethyldihydropteridine diphosphokinase [Candidatus Eiseniibacteriota bacterium]|jgi:2-amino-4-hydroxy-6-hydroxymethyldihydropteridine diphosphokinase
MKAYVGLGSNLGEREALIRVAIENLARLPETRLARVSSLYDTAPVGELDQPNFLNAVAQLESELTARQLLWNMLLVERRLGRVRHASRRYGPRTIDLDLLLYGNLVLDEPDLTLPHPEIAKRAFVLIPLVELDPGLLHPTLGETVADLLAKLEARPAVRRMSRLWT